MKDADKFNTPRYWNKVYKDEIKRGMDRADPVRWDTIISEIKSSDKVLDFGCGTGDFIAYLKEARPSAYLYGVDSSNVAIKEAKRKCPEAMFWTGLDEAKFPLKFFDVIVLSHVIEHFQYPEQLITRLMQHLKDDGLLVLVIPVNDDEWKEHYKIWRIKDVIELLNDLGFYYRIIHRNPVMVPLGENMLMTITKKQSGREFEEAIVFAIRK